MNPLMQQLSGETLQESPETLVKNLMGILRGNDPQKVIQMMAIRNPQFAQFMRECEGKTPEQVASSHGLDLKKIKKML